MPEPQPPNRLHRPHRIGDGRRVTLRSHGGMNSCTINSASTEAFKWFSRAAAASNVRAMEGVSVCFEHGLSVEKSGAKVAELSKKRRWLERG